MRALGSTCVVMRGRALMHHPACTRAALNFSLHRGLRLVEARAAQDEAKEIQLLVCMPEICNSGSMHAVTAVKQDASPLA